MTTALAPYTLDQLRTETQYLTGDLKGTRFSPPMEADAINFAIKMLVTRMGYTYKDAQIPQIAGSAAFPYGPCFPLLTILDYLEIRRVAAGHDTVASPAAQATYPLNKTTLAQEDMDFPRWRNSSGVPQRWALLDGGDLVVFPLPIQTSQGAPIFWTATVGYIQQPALLSLGADTVDIRIPYAVQQYLKYAAASWLLALDETDTTSLQTSKILMDTFIAYLGG